MYKILKDIDENLPLPQVLISFSKGIIIHAIKNKSNYFVFKKMKKCLLFFVIVCMGIHPVFGQSFSLILNNESSGLNDYTVRQFDVFSFSSNPSTLMNE